MASWRDMAIDVLADCLLEYEVQAVLLEQPITFADARKYCNDRYPFRERNYTPYKIWLEELKLVITFISLGQPAINYKNWRSRVTSKGCNARKQTVPSPGQLSLPL